MSEAMRESLLIGGLALASGFAIWRRFGTDKVKEWILGSFSAAVGISFSAPFGTFYRLRGE